MLLVFVCGWFAPAALEEKKAFVSFGLQKKEIHFIMLNFSVKNWIFNNYFPAHCRGG